MLVPTDGPRRLQSLRGREAHALALLSAAYDRAVAPSVLGNIERAAKAWGEGDDCLAYIHLAHAGLQPIHDFRGRSLSAVHGQLRDEAPRVATRRP